MTVKVKPLVWFPAPSICTREKAEAMGGHYSVVEFDAGTDEHHFAANIDLGGLAFVFILEPDPFGGRRPKRYPTIEAAKAAAQADYEARVLAALEAPPDEIAALRAKLAEADRDEERKLADDLAYSLKAANHYLRKAGYTPYTEATDRHAARRKEQQG